MAVVDNVDDVFTDSNAIIAYRQSIEILLRKLARNQSTIQVFRFYFLNV